MLAAGVILAIMTLPIITAISRDALISVPPSLRQAAFGLGATRWEAALAPIRHAIRTGMIPIMNSMMVVGIVSLPGMMTGQLISGTAPLHAVQYQIVIMFLIASATALGTVGVVLLTYYRMFNHDHQFLSERLN